MHNHRGNMANATDMLKEIIVSIEETIIHEVVALNTRQRNRLLWFAEFLNQRLIWQES